MIIKKKYYKKKPNAIFILFNMHGIKKKQKNNT